MNKKEKIEHIKLLQTLVDKQKILYARLSLSDDPRAKQMKENIRESAKNLGFPDDGDLNKMFAFDVKYDNIDDGGIGGTRITNSGLDDP